MISGKTYYLWVASDVDGRGTQLQLETNTGLPFVTRLLGNSLVQDSSNTGAIVGFVALVALVVILAGIIFCNRRKTVTNIEGMSLDFAEPIIAVGERRVP